jgi:hypothetical protein
MGFDGNVALHDLAGNHQYHLGDGGVHRAEHPDACLLIEIVEQIGNDGPAVVDVFLDDGKISPRFSGES